MNVSHLPVTYVSYIEGLGAHGALAFQTRPPSLKASDERPPSRDEIMPEGEEEDDFGPGSAPDPEGEDLDATNAIIKEAISSDEN